MLPVSAMFHSIALPIEDQQYGHILLERLEFEDGNTELPNCVRSSRISARV